MSLWKYNPFYYSKKRRERQQRSADRRFHMSRRQKISYESQTGAFIWITVKISGVSYFLFAVITRRDMIHFLKLSRKVVAIIKTRTIGNLRNRISCCL